MTSRSRVAVGCTPGTNARSLMDTLARAITRTRPPNRNPQHKLWTTLDSLAMGVVARPIPRDSMPVMGKRYLRRPPMLSRSPSARPTWGVMDLGAEGKE